MNCNYNTEHIEFIKKNILGCSFQNLADKFNKQFGMALKASTIASLADRHGLHNGRDTRLNKGYEPTQFKKGSVPINKGTKGMFNVGGNKTSFKKGQMPHNWVSIGSERITKDGYIQIKVDEGKFQHNWKGKHIIVWESHNGPVPKGYAVMFGDGNKRNFDISNLILVSRNQLKTLNQKGLIQNDADLTRTAVVIADVFIKISDRKKR